MRSSARTMVSALARDMTRSSDVSSREVPSFRRASRRNRRARKTQREEKRHAPPRCARVVVVSVLHHGARRCARRAKDERDEKRALDGLRSARAATRPDRSIRGAARARERERDPSSRPPRCPPRRDVLSVHVDRTIAIARSLDRILVDRYCQYPSSRHVVSYSGNASLKIIAVRSLHPGHRPNVLLYPYTDIVFASSSRSIRPPPTTKATNALSFPVVVVARADARISSRNLAKLSACHVVPRRARTTRIASSSRPSTRTCARTYFHRPESTTTRGIRRNGESSLGARASTYEDDVAARVSSNAASLSASPVTSQNLGAGGMDRGEGGCGEGRRVAEGNTRVRACDY